MQDAVQHRLEDILSFIGKHDATSSKGFVWIINYSEPKAIKSAEYVDFDVDSPPNAMLLRHEAIGYFVTISRLDLILSSHIHQESHHFVCWKLTFYL